MIGSSATIQGFGRFDDKIFEMSKEQTFITRRILSDQEESQRVFFKYLTFNNYFIFSVQSIGISRVTRCALKQLEVKKFRF